RPGWSRQTPCGRAAAPPPAGPRAQPAQPRMPGLPRETPRGSRPARPREPPWQAPPSPELERLAPRPARLTRPLRAAARPGWEPSRSARVRRVAASPPAAPRRGRPGPLPQPLPQPLVQAGPDRPRRADSRPGAASFRPGRTFPSEQAPRRLGLGLSAPQAQRQARAELGRPVTPRWGQPARKALQPPAAARYPRYPAPVLATWGPPSSASERPLREGRAPPRWGLPARPP